LPELKAIEEFLNYLIKVQKADPRKKIVLISYRKGNFTS
jgi:hypothetical protein